MKMEKLDDLKDLVVIYTPEEAEMINGGRRGRGQDDPPGSEDPPNHG